MLKQVLHDMKVEPDLLELLSEDQKELLFAKIREEQKRRWCLKEKDLEKQESVSPPKRTPAKINFLLGSDRQPWVWVMGEHPDDTPYEELVAQREKEEQERERLREMQDRKEAEELAKLETTIVSGANGPSRTISAPVMIDQSPVKESPSLERKGDLKKIKYGSLWKKAVAERATLIGSSEQEKEDFKKRRTQELFDVVQKARQIAKMRAQEVSKEVEQRWKTSEEKAKVFERTRKLSLLRTRQIVEQAPQKVEEILGKLPESPAPISALIKTKPREALGSLYLPTRKTSVVYRGTAPKSQAHVINWFRENEAPKGVGQENDGSISIWFHGLIDRAKAEELLEPKPVGTFLVRITLKLWGYTVSVKGYTESKHFMIDASSGQGYHFMGPKQREFPSLLDLLSFYRTNPITWSGQEMLILPCEQISTREWYKGLYRDEEDEDEDEDKEEVTLL
ncbi:hypothetical protein EMCRGX_G034994 [Ephydatia muelleri]|eukprot:Em0023g938a